MNFWNEEVYKKKLQWNTWPFPEVISSLLNLSREHEVLDKTVQGSMAYALRKQDIRPAMQPKIELKDGELISQRIRRLRPWA
jgi:hypothetical protein